MSTPAPTPPTTATTAKQAGTPYIILEQIDGSQWAIIGRETATNPAAAIRATVGGNANGTLVAIPARSWRPVKVTVQQVSKVTLENA